ncbi:uncharacterized protein BDW70DRAFT_100817 [Aspergillus foveolatus]|uniref:uncharacterized protein n=1 Tax=Aspergillus foveolatus TaxID=210207 RepID=UPI003CCDC979
MFRSLAGIGGSATSNWRRRGEVRSQGHGNLSWILGGTYRGGFIVQFSTWRWVFWATSAAAVGIQVVGLIWLREYHAPTLLCIRRDRLAGETGNENLHTLEKDRRSLMSYSMPSRGRSSCFHPTYRFCMAINIAYLFGITYIMFATSQRSELSFIMKSPALVAWTTSLLPLTLSFVSSSTKGC